jgi:hypothetical protein
MGFPPLRSRSISVEVVHDVLLHLIQPYLGGAP